MSKAMAQGEAGRSVQTDCFKECPAVWNGIEKIYPCWKSLVQKWCEADYDVYLVSPMFGKKQMEWAYGIFEEHGHRGNLHIYAREEKTAKRDFKDEAETLNEYVVMLKGLGIDIKIPTATCFHAMFIAGAPKSGDRIVELMITSANFTDAHFTSRFGKENHDTVSFSLLAYNDFDEYFLKMMNDICSASAPLATGGEDTFEMMTFDDLLREPGEYQLCQDLPPGQDSEPTKPQAVHAIWSGHRRVYPCWKQLLSQWCDKDYEVYVVSPQIGKRYFVDVCKMFGPKDGPKEEMGSVHIYTRDEGIELIEKPFKKKGKTGWTKMNDEEKKEKKKENEAENEQLLKKHNHQQEQWLKADKRRQKAEKLFHAKFIAGVPKSDDPNRTVELMITSANFQESHFYYTARNHETVSFTRLTFDIFKANFLDKMDNICEVYNQRTTTCKSRVKRKRISVDTINSGPSEISAESAESTTARNVREALADDETARGGQRKRRRPGCEKSGNETVQVQSSAASSDNTDLPIPSDSKSEEEHSIDFCRQIQSSHSFLIAANYDDRDLLVHVEVREENKLETEKSVKRLEEQFKEERGYCPKYTFQLYEDYEYIQTCSPPRSKDPDDPTETAPTSAATKLPLRPGTRIQSTTLQKQCLFSGTLNDNKGVSVAHAFKLDGIRSHDVETVPNEKDLTNVDVATLIIGKCSKVFETKDVSDVAFIEIDTEKCNPENTVYWPSNQRQRRIRIHRGAPVAGNTRVMILNKDGKFKEGFIRREQDIQHILGNMCDMMAISSEKEFKQKIPITNGGDSGALVMSIPNDDESEIDVYGIVTGLIRRKDPLLTIANDFPEVLRKLSDMNEVSRDIDFK